MSRKALVRGLVSAVGMKRGLTPGRLLLVDKLIENRRGVGARKVGDEKA